MADNKIADRRRNRIESQIINILNHTIKYEAYDQELKMISFTYVKLTDDKTLAKVYVDTYNRKNIDRFVKKLNDSASLFKRALASELQIWKTPNLLFCSDESIERNIKIENLIKNIKK